MNDFYEALRGYNFMHSSIRYKLRGKEMSGIIDRVSLTRDTLSTSFIYFGCPRNYPFWANDWNVSIEGKTFTFDRKEKGQKEHYTSDTIPMSIDSITITVGNDKYFERVFTGKDLRGLNFKYHLVNDDDNIIINNIESVRFGHNGTMTLFGMFGALVFYPEDWLVRVNEDDITLTRINDVNDNKEFTNIPDGVVKFTINTKEHT